MDVFFLSLLFSFDGKIVSIFLFWWIYTSFLCYWIFYDDLFFMIWFDDSVELVCNIFILLFSFIEYFMTIFLMIVWNLFAIYFVWQLLNVLFFFFWIIYFFLHLWNNNVELVLKVWIATSSSYPYRFALDLVCFSSLE